jgi:hypothetical protein
MTIDWGKVVCAVGLTVPEIWITVLVSLCMGLPVGLPVGLPHSYLKCKPEEYMRKQRMQCMLNLQHGMAWHGMAWHGIRSGMRKYQRGRKVHSNTGHSYWLAG